VDAVIKILDKGPLHVKGKFELYDAAGNRFEIAEQFTLCRCGHSQHTPFCDGSHRVNGFSDCPRAKMPAGA
jgi:CDGSH-type Zn-finger protein